MADSLQFYKKQAESATIRADQAEDKLESRGEWYRRQAKSKNELVETVVNSAITMGTAASMRVLRHNVDVVVLKDSIELDLTGVLAFGLLTAGALGYGGKYNKELMSSGTGVGTEFLLNKVDGAYADKAAGLDEDTGALRRDDRRDRRDDRRDRNDDRRDRRDRNDNRRDLGDMRPARQGNREPIYTRAEVIDA